MTSRPSTAAPLLAVLAIVQGMLGAYVGGCFWLAAFSKGAKALSLSMVSIIGHKVDGVAVLRQGGKLPSTSL
jgi:hypothetical protein